MKSQYKAFFLILIIVALELFKVNAQTNPITITVNIDESGASQQRIARDNVKLLPGFKYIPSNTTSWLGKTDLQMISNVPYQQPVEPGDRPLDTNLPVGSTPGVASVSQSGAANYSIPIFIAPGTANMQPSLSVEYNSMAGNGLLGIGWSIQGLSAITRTGTTLYHDGFIDGVDMDYNDGFALDGQRLIYVSGYIYTTAEYRTEIESFSKITSYKSNSYNGVNPDYFIVEPKQGGSMEYGNSANSIYKVPGTTNQNFKWLLNKVIDNNGNYMSYVYENIPNSSEQVIKEINYTANDIAGISTYNSVRFYYENGRTDNSLFYMNNAAFDSKSLLYKIEIVSEGEIIKKYEFNYSSDFYTHLTEIKEYGNDGSVLNSTLLNYGIATTAIAQNTTSMASLNNNDQIFFADINGDGKSDILTVEYDPFTGTCPYWKYYSSNSNGTSFTLSQNEYNPISEIDLSPVPYSYLLPGDFDGDGLSDAIKVDILNPTQSELQYHLYLLHSNGSTLEKIDLGLSFDEADLNTLSNSHYIFRRGDFDGDGRAELLILQSSPFSIDWDMYLYRINSSGTPLTTLICTHYNDDYDIGNQPIIADFNGNGKSDILANNLLFEFDNYSNSIKHVIPFTSVLWTDPSLGVVIPGDFNGDGKTDVLQWKNVQPPTFPWCIQLSTGTGFVTVPNLCPITRTEHPNAPPDNRHYNTPADNYFYYATDYNGDGKSDIVEIYRDNEYSTYYYLNVYYSNGTTFSQPETNTVNYSSLTSPNTYPYYDFNGDGKSDIFVQNMSSGQQDIIFFHPNEKKHLLHKVTNSFNQSIEFVYTPLTQGAPFYTKSETLSYPFNIFQVPLYLVSQFIYPDGIGGSITNNYNYSNAVLQKTGLGFLGFKAFSYSNDIHSFTYTFNLNQTYSRMTPNSVLEKDPANVDLMAGISTYDFVLYPPNPYYVPMLTGNNAQNKLNGTSVITNYQQYDNFGNSTDILKEYYSGTTQDATSRTINTYIAKGSWCDNKVNTSSVTLTRYGESGSYAREKSYSYDNNGNLLSETTDPSKQKALTATINTINLVGLPVRVTTSSSGLGSRYFDYGYDTKFRFITTKTNQLGQVSTAEYDNGTGNILKSTDISGLTTHFRYDGFGNQVEVKTPDNIATNTEYKFYEEGLIDRAIYYTNSTTPNRPDSKTYYDASGREIRKETDGFNGKLVADIIYNHIGKTDRYTEPYFDTDPPQSIQWVENTYNHGRISSITMNSDQVILYGYQYGTGTTNIIYPSGKTKSQTYDALGNIVREIDNGQTIDYYYNNAGLLRQTSYQGSNIDVTYDDYGRQQTLTDPDAGTMNYVYNAFGELETQTDARNITSTMVYDDLGRIYTKTLSTGEVTTYTYNTTGNGLGLISLITTSPANTSKSFQYDNLNRITQITENVNSHQFTTQYTYNNLGQNSQIIYPSGFSISNFYNTKGSLEEIKRTDNGNSIWKLETINAKGQVTQYKNFNNFYTNKTFDAVYDNLQNITTGTIFNMSFTFDHNTMNLLSRTDNIKNLNENFNVIPYDNFDRLKSMQVSNQPLYSMDFSNNGNITNKTDAGVYTYDNQKIHAVKYIDSPQNISSLQQNITYNSYSKATEITEPGNIKKLTLTYGPSEERNYTEYSENGNVIKQKYFAQNYEKEIAGSNTTEWNYINTPDGLSFVYRKENGNGTLYSVCKDHLGSILALVNTDGTIAEEYNYDAWGRRRNPVNWSYTGVPTPTMIDRGFTGHEHLDDFVLINMNGRLYDPVLGMMLSPDVFVQNPYDPLNLNRYSYALNNPLKYTDPNGKQIGFIIGAIIGAYIGGMLINEGELNPLSWDWKTEETYEGIILGGIMGGIGGAAVEGLFLATPTTTLGVGLITPLGTVGVGINASLKVTDFHWTTTAGGGGGINFTRDENIAPMEIRTMQSIEYSVYRSKQMNSRDRIESIEVGPLVMTGWEDENYIKTPGVHIYESNLMSSGSGFSVPPFGIVVGTGTSIGVREHEVGHYIDYKVNGAFFYYTSIVPGSVYSVTRSIFDSEWNHHAYWTEMRASTYGYWYYGNYYGNNSQSNLEKWPKY